MSHQLRATLIAIAETEQQLFKLKQDLRRLDQQIQEAQGQLTPTEQELQRLQTEQQQLLQLQQDSEKELEEQRLLIEKLELHVPRIRNEKEFEASKKQLEVSRKHKAQLEDKLLELAIRLEELGPRVQTQAELLEEKRQASQLELKETLKEQETTARAIEDLQKYFQQAFASAPRQIQRFHQRCLQSGVSRPITPVRSEWGNKKPDGTKKSLGKTCSGCNIHLQPQFVNEFLTDPDNYRNCPHCNRILYMPLNEEEVAENA